MIGTRVLSGPLEERLKNGFGHFFCISDPSPPGTTKQKCRNTRLQFVWESDVFEWPGLCMHPIKVPICVGQLWFACLFDVSKEQREWSGGSGNWKISTNPLEKRLLDQAQARASYTPFFEVIRVAYPKA